MLHPCLSGYGSMGHGGHSIAGVSYAPSHQQIMTPLAFINKRVRLWTSQKVPKTWDPNWRHLVSTLVVLVEGAWRTITPSSHPTPKPPLSCGFDGTNRWIADNVATPLRWAGLPGAITRLQVKRIKFDKCRGSLMAWRAKNNARAGFFGPLSHAREATR